MVVVSHLYIIPQTSEKVKGFSGFSVVAGRKFTEEWGNIYFFEKRRGGGYGRSADPAPRGGLGRKVASRARLLTRPGLRTPRPKGSCAGGRLPGAADNAPGFIRSHRTFFLIPPFPPSPTEKGGARVYLYARGSAPCIPEAAAGEFQKTSRGLGRRSQAGRGYLTRPGF